MTKQCNTWYSAEDRSLCTYDQMKACGERYSFEDVIAAGYTDWYLGFDLAQVLDLASVWFGAYVGFSEAEELVANGLPADHYRLFIHALSWMPANKLQQHINADKFSYYDYLDTELFLCNGAGGENIDTQQIYEQVAQIREKHDLHFVTVAGDPYNIAGIQDALVAICDTFILQNQSPKALSQYIEALSQYWKDRMIAYHAGHEDILEKAITNSVLVRNNTGYYSVEKITLRADSNIRIDPVDAMVTGFIAAYIDFNKRGPTGDEMVDDWLDMFK